MKVFFVAALVLLTIEIFGQTSSTKSLPDVRLSLLQKQRLDAKGRDPLRLGWYRISTAKLIGFGVVTLGGFVDGTVEGYEFDGRTSFERKWGSDPAGFWGSESWRSIYNDGDPSLGPKSGFAKWRGARDFYHTADDLRKLSYLSGSISIGIGGAKVNTRWWHYLVDFGISYAISGFAKSRGMNWVRH
jgi:hypothetical protein